MQPLERPAPVGGPYLARSLMRLKNAARSQSRLLPLRNWKLKIVVNLCLCEPETQYIFLFMLVFTLKYDKIFYITHFTGGQDRKLYVSHGRDRQEDSRRFAAGCIVIGGRNR